MSGLLVRQRPRGARHFASAVETLKQFSEFEAARKALKGKRQDSARQPLDRLQHIAESYFPSTPAHGLALAYLAHTFWLSGDWAHANTLLHQALKALSSASDAQVQALQHQMALQLFQVGDFEGAVRHGDASGSLGEPVAKIARAVAEGNTLGLPPMAEYALSDLSGEPPAEDALNHPSSPDSLLLRISVGEAMVIAGHGKAPAVLANALAAVQQLSEEEQARPELQSGVARSLANLGRLAHAQDQAVTAEGLFLGALDIHTKELKIGRQPLWHSSTHRGLALLYRSWDGRDNDAARSENQATELERLLPDSVRDISTRRRWALACCPNPSIDSVLPFFEEDV
uniref:Uncharacterized protein n=1 Tax=Oxyrrhis marina TaxID=2969 RepID=A0A7S3UKI4_OXYMA